MLRLTSNHNPLQTRVLAAWISYQRDHPVSRANALGQLCAAIRYQARENALQTPLLILGNGADRLIDPRCSQSLA